MGWRARVLPPLLLAAPQLPAGEGRLLVAVLPAAGLESKRGDGSE